MIFIIKNKIVLQFCPQKRQNFPQKAQIFLNISGKILKFGGENLNFLGMIFLPK